MLYPEDDQQDHAEPELGHRVQRQRDSGGDLVEGLPRFHPALMPIHTPMIEASTMAVPTSSSVGQMRSVTIPTPAG